MAFIDSADESPTSGNLFWEIHDDQWQRFCVDVLDPNYFLVTVGDLDSESEHQFKIHKEDLKELAEWVASL